MAGAAVGVAGIETLQPPVVAGSAEDEADFDVVGVVADKKRANDGGCGLLMEKGQQTYCDVVAAIDSQRTARSLLLPNCPMAADWRYQSLAGECW